MFGAGAISGLGDILVQKESDIKSNYVIYYIDHYFKDSELLSNLPISNEDEIFYVNSDNEPETSDMNNFRDILVSKNKKTPKAIVSIGGGCTLDTGKAVANLLTNPGNAEEYQGWDLVKNPGIYKIGIPTISGTGAEASRTCVMINPENGLKLGMNSDFTIYDQLILDPNLTKSVPRNQYFYTGMDTYLHCVESLNGRYRNAIGDAFANQAIALCREVFLSDDMMSDENREKLMIASYLGGCAIANSFVGVVHPFSAGLSVVLGTHHCVGNCIAMSALKEFYPREHDEFYEMINRQKVEIPAGLTKNLEDRQFEQLYKSTIIHEKPLANALGDNFKTILTPAKVEEIFKRM